MLWQESFLDRNVIGAFVIGFVILLMLRKYFGKKYLPGPYGLPVVGYLPFMTDKPHLKLWELSQKYGPVYSLKMGSRYIIVMCDFYTIKEAFQQDAFFGRPPDSAFELSEETIRLGAIQSYGWKEQRRFALHSLRNLGFGKVSMEQHMKDELHDLLEEMEKHVGKPLYVSNLLSPSVSNNISSLVFGKRKDFDDPDRIMLNDIIRHVGRTVSQAAWHSFFPWVKKIVHSLRLGPYDGLVKALKDLRAYVDREIKEHKKTLQPTGIRDFIDAYLMEIEKRKKEPGTNFTINVLQDQVIGFFGAGSETVRLSLEWLLLVCAAKPEIQKKVHQEIDDIIGRDRYPTKADEKQMPFTNAVIMETMRWKTLVPINILRYTLEDTELRSYFIPKGAYVIANLWAVHHDKSLWGDDAEEFKPERFLSEDGNEIRKPEYYIPFSVGKRSCPGETLAIAETFMYFTAILQKFQLKLAEGTDVEKCLEGNLGIGLAPNPYDLVLQLRK